MHIKHKYLLFGLFGIEKTVFSANMLSSFCRNCSLYINLILYHLPVDGSTYLILRKESLYNNNTVVPNIQVSFCVCVCVYVCVCVCSYKCAPNPKTKSQILISKIVFVWYRF